LLHAFLGFPRGASDMHAVKKVKPHVLRSSRPAEALQFVVVLSAEHCACTAFTLERLPCAGHMHHEPRPCMCIRLDLCPAFGSRLESRDGALRIGKSIGFLERPSLSSHFEMLALQLCHERESTQRYIRPATEKVNICKRHRACTYSTMHTYMDSWGKKNPNHHHRYRRHCHRQQERARVRECAPEESTAWS
jgi:hypothetical protein